jgi:hypothetical protein
LTVLSRPWGTRSDPGPSRGGGRYGVRGRRAHPGSRRPGGGRSG